MYVACTRTQINCLFKSGVCARVCVCARVGLDLCVHLSVRACMTSCRYPQAYLSQIAAVGQTQIMVEENKGPDFDNGLVMVYKLSPNEVLPLVGGDLNVGSTYSWHKGNGEYYEVRNNAPGSGCWYGISCHAGAWRNMQTSQRCTYKPDFTKTSANNADYKMDHCGAHAGTTRCVHGKTGIGVAHFIRFCQDIGKYGLAAKGKC